MEISSQKLYALMIFISLVLNCVAGSITKERSRPSLRGGFDLKQGLRKLRLIAAFNLMQKYAGEGVNLEEARKRNKLIDSVVRDFTDRNNNNMGEREKATVVTTYALAFCDLCRQLNNQACISRHCYNV